LGIQSVFFTLLMYPSLLAYKQVALLTLAGQDLPPTEQLSIVASLNVLAAMLLILAWAAIAMVPMYARYHHLGRWGKTRVAVAFVVAISITMPFLYWALPWLYKLGKFL
jgi:hypothetical protein